MTVRRLDTPGLDDENSVVVFFFFFDDDANIYIISIVFVVVVVANYYYRIFLMPDPQSTAERIPILEPRIENRPLPPPPAPISLLYIS